MSNELAVTAPAEPSVATTMGFDDPESFKHMQRVAKVFTSSALVPESFRGDANIGNAIIALNMSRRMGADPMAIMQNIYIVHGKPAWSSQFVIACINSCGRYSPIRFQVTGTGEAKTCIAWATEKATGERLEGPPVSMEMAKLEGWSTKSGSKWKTMGDLMLRYRAATFFGRLYAPEILMGMHSVEEVHDVGETQPKVELRVNEPTPNRPALAEASAKVIEAAIVAQPTPQQQVEDFLTAAGVKFEDFKGWLVTTGGITADATLDDCHGLLDAFAVELLSSDARALKLCAKIYAKK